MHVYTFFNDEFSGWWSEEWSLGLLSLGTMHSK